MTDIFTILPYGKNKELIKLSRPKKAILYYLNHSIDLITGAESEENITTYLDYLDSKKLREESSLFEVHHLFYELSDIILFDEFKSPYNNLPLAIKILYSKEEKLEGVKKRSRIKLSNTLSPDKTKYEEGFFKGREELLKGNSYQFNYTHHFKYSFDGSSAESFIDSFMALGDKLGQFAHLTYIPLVDKVIFSNSPESLFQARVKSGSVECLTTPIKGTVKRHASVPISRQWNELKNDLKNQGELYMIVDLLRNDLSSIEEPTAQIVKKKTKLLVPGLIHQMGVIKVRFSSRVSLGKVIRSLFPGGSITGAPKKSTVSILKELEDGPRGIYTGSTLLIRKNQIDCSINIRTADIDLKYSELSYGAGGGVTLMSNFSDEYTEMHDKVASFINLL